MKKLRGICIAVLALTAGLCASADTLGLARGEVLTGDLVEIADGTVVFRTNLAGQMIVPVDNVDYVTTDKPLAITTNNGDSFQALLTQEDGACKAVLPDGRTGRAITLADIVSAAPVSGNTATTPSNAEDADDLIVTGEWEGGYLQHWGRSDYAAPFTRLSLRHENDRYRFLSSALLDLDDEEDFPRLFRFLAEWQLAPDRMTRPLLGLALERDTDSALRLRGDIDVGFDHFFTDTQANKLQVGTGLNFEFDYYDSELLTDDTEAGLRAQLRELQSIYLLNDLLSTSARDQAAAFHRSILRFASFAYYADDRQRDDDQNINLRLRLRHLHIFPRGASISEDLALYPSLTDFGGFRARSESSLSLPLTDQLRLKLNILVDYDDEPRFESLDNWRTSVGAGIAWTF